MTYTCIIKGFAASWCAQPLWHHSITSSACICFTHSQLSCFLYVGGHRNVGFQNVCVCPLTALTASSGRRQNIFTVHAIVGKHTGCHSCCICPVGCHPSEVSPSVGKLSVSVNGTFERYERCTNGRGWLLHILLRFLFLVGELSG